jgi:hypothetical protein
VQREQEHGNEGGGHDKVAAPQLQTICVSGNVSGGSPPPLRAALRAPPTASNRTPALP